MLLTYDMDGRDRFMGASFIPSYMLICSWYFVYRQWIQHTWYTFSWCLTPHIHIHAMTSRSRNICCIIHAYCVRGGHRWSSTEPVLCQRGTGPNHKQVLMWQGEYSRECHTKSWNIPGRSDISDILHMWYMMIYDAYHMIYTRYAIYHMIYHIPWIHHIS